MSFQYFPVTGLYSLIEEYEVPSNTSSFDFASTLDGDNDGGYYIDGILYPANTVDVRLRINSTQCAGGFQQLSGSGTSSSANRNTTNNRTIYGYVNSATIFSILMPESKVPSVAWRQTMTSMTGGTGSTTPVVWHLNNHITTPSYTANITSLGFDDASASNRIGAGSLFRLYKLNA